MKVILLLVVCIYFCEAYPNCNTNAHCPDDMCCAVLPEDAPGVCARKPQLGNPCTGLYYQIEPESDDHCNCGPDMTCENMQNSGNTFYYCANQS